MLGPWNSGGEVSLLALELGPRLDHDQPLSIYLPICIYFYPSMSISIHLSISIYIHVYLYIHTSIDLETVQAGG